MKIDEVFALIQDVPDFPKPGITFKDITPIFESPDAFSKLTEALNEHVPSEVTTLAAIESRGFLLAAAMTQKKPRKVVLLRKPGKLPRKTLSQSYDLEYGTDTLEIHEDSLRPGEKVCIVDDILATGGTASAAELLVKKAGGEVSSLLFMMELGFLGGDKKLTHPFKSLLKLT